MNIYVCEYYFCVYKLNKKQQSCQAETLVLGYYVFDESTLASLL